MKWYFFPPIQVQVRGLSVHLPVHLNGISHRKIILVNSLYTDFDGKNHATLLT